MKSNIQKVKSIIHKKTNPQNHPVETNAATTFTAWRATHFVLKVNITNLFRGSCRSFINILGKGLSLRLFSCTTGSRSSAGAGARGRQPSALAVGRGHRAGRGTDQPWRCAVDSEEELSGPGLCRGNGWLWLPRSPWGSPGRLRTDEPWQRCGRCRAAPGHKPHCARGLHRAPLRLPAPFLLC